MKPDYWIRLKDGGTSLVLPSNLVADGSGTRVLEPGAVVGVIDDKLFRGELRRGSIERVPAPVTAKAKE